MQFLEQEIRQVTETVWESVLGVTLLRGQKTTRRLERSMAGCVQFSGAWEGAITVECSTDFARHAAATMFGVERSATSEDDARDAIGELTNMTGGNVKALLPEPCRLSLPTVLEGSATTGGHPGGEPVTTVSFDCLGSPLVVRLLRKHRPGEV
ncbi:MAG TPA: chemotaxis protein CheX [Gemmatimonadales bacterium]|nr:chemotaxis protein CheX [Gemmatimonadales bacterium]